MDSNKRKKIFMLGIIIAMIIWGGAWISAKLIFSEKMTAPIITFWRFVLTAFFAALTIVFTGQSFKMSKKGFLISVLGGFFLGIYNLAFFTGVNVGLAGAGGVLTTSLNPIFTFILSLILFKEKINLKEGFGLLLGLAGGCVLLEIWSINTQKLFDGGNIYFLFCAVVWGLATICSQRSSKYIPFFGYFFYISLFASVIVFFSVPSSKDILLVFNQGFNFWGNELYLSLLANNFASGIYFYASTKLGANKTSSFIFIVPASAVFLSWIFLGEFPTWNTIVGGIIAIAAVYIINAAKKQTKG